jgi:ABC-type dipeptide/oligopeptide/nickel transport system permease component
MIFAASVIIFLMLRLGTGDPALDYLRLSNLPPTPEMVASTRTMLGLDQPLVVQYGHWLWRRCISILAYHLPPSVRCLTMCCASCPQRCSWRARRWC